MIVAHCCNAALPAGVTWCYLWFVEGDARPAERPVKLSAVTLVTAATLLAAGAALADTLLPGHLLAGAPGSDTAAGDSSLSMDQFSASRDSAAMSVQFTPRNPMTLLFPDAEPTLAEPAELRLSVARDEALASRFAALGSAEAPTGPLSMTGPLEIGGAFRWADWMVGSGYARAPLFGGAADLVSASIGYGPVEARLAYGQSTRAQADTLDVLMLSTDLAAWSWLTVESDVAVGASQDRQTEQLAVGRLGVRLNF
jgi:hypothetical protein